MVRMVRRRSCWIIVGGLRFQFSVIRCQALSIGEERQRGAPTAGLFFMDSGFRHIGTAPE